MRLVVSIAKRYLPSAGHAFTLDDLISLGCVGLLRGIDLFDPAKSHKLSTYATWWIRQAISRGIAEEGRVMTRSVGAKCYRPARPPPRPAAPAAAGTESAGPAARPRALPGGVGRPPGLVGGAGRPSGTGWPGARSLNARLHADDAGSELGDIVPDQHFDPEAAALESAVRHDIAAALARLLSERERRFLRAYFGFDTGQKATLEEVGATEGLTRERVRQVIAEAIQKLRQDPVVAAYRELIIGG
jgi:RNA polymerase sigma factor (sigma-70 family)